MSISKSPIMQEFDKIFSVRPQESEYFLPTRLAGWATLVTSDGPASVFGQKLN